MVIEIVPPTPDSFDAGKDAFTALNAGKASFPAFRVCRQVGDLRDRCRNNLAMWGGSPSAGGGGTH
jgi:hypothetical protein